MPGPKPNMINVLVIPPDGKLFAAPVNLHSEDMDVLVGGAHWISSLRAEVYYLTLSSVINLEAKFDGAPRNEVASNIARDDVFGTMLVVGRALDNSVTTVPPEFCKWVVDNLKNEPAPEMTLP